MTFWVMRREFALVDYLGVEFKFLDDVGRARLERRLFGREDFWRLILI